MADDECFIVVVADMQPGPSGANIPPQVVSAQIRALSPAPDFILMPGDEAGDGLASEYAVWSSYYGVLQSRTYAVPGNHDWGNVPGSGDLTAYDDEFGAQGGESATPPHFVSFDTPNGWHVLGFDSSTQWIGSVSNPSATYNAVAEDLAANAGKPLIAFWHHPRWSDGTDTADPGGTADTLEVSDIWNLLRDHDADIVLNGHCHSYQRFPKLGKTGDADDGGICEFVVGTGGSGLFTLTGTGRAEVNSYQEAAYDQLKSQWFGYLALRLTPTSYSWEFISQDAAGSENPGAVLDSGGPVQTNVSLNQGNVMASVNITVLNLRHKNGSALQPGVSTVTTADVGILPADGHIIARVAPGATGGTLTVQAAPGYKPLLVPFTASAVFFLGIADTGNYVQSDGKIHLTADQGFAATAITH